MDRMRRLRMNETLRDMVRENHVRVDELIYPVFVAEGENICHPVESMPGICQYSIDRLPEELDRTVDAGVRAVLLFGIPAHKDEVGSTGIVDWCEMGRFSMMRRFHCWQRHRWYMQGQVRIS